MSCSISSTATPNFAPQLIDQRLQVALFLRVQAGGTEQSAGAVYDHCSAHLQAALVAATGCPASRLANSCKPMKSSHWAASRQRLGFGLPVGFQLEQARQQARSTWVLRHQQVLQHRQAVEQPHVLERAHQAWRATLWLGSR